MTIMLLAKFARQSFAKDGLPKYVLTEGKGNIQSICIPDSIKVSLECCAQSCRKFQGKCMAPVNFWAKYITFYSIELPRSLGYSFLSGNCLYCLSFYSRFEGSIFSFSFHINSGYMCNRK